MLSFVKNKNYNDKFNFYSFSFEYDRRYTMLRTEIRLLPMKKWPTPKSRDLVLNPNKDTFAAVYSTVTAKMLHNKKSRLNFYISNGIKYLIGGVTAGSQKCAATIQYFIKNAVNIFREATNYKDEDVDTVLWGDKDVDTMCLYSAVDALEKENLNPTVIMGNDDMNAYIRDNEITFWGSSIDNLHLSNNDNSEKIKNKIQETFDENAFMDSGLDFSILEKIPPQALRHQ